jgi:hypothetical protein
MRPLFGSLLIAKSEAGKYINARSGHEERPGKAQDARGRVLSIGQVIDRYVSQPVLPFVGDPMVKDKILRDLLGRVGLIAVDELTSHIVPKQGKR